MSEKQNDYYPSPQATNLKMLGAAAACLLPIFSFAADTTPVTINSGDTA